MMIKVWIQNFVKLEKKKYFIFYIGKYLYKLPSADLREKSNRLISNKTSTNNQLDSTQILTNLVKDTNDQQN